MAHPSIGADKIVALEAQLAEAKAENERLREGLARIANNINVKGSAYDQAMIALDSLVRDVKREARMALTGEPA